MRVAPSFARVFQLAIAAPPTPKTAQRDSHRGGGGGREETKTCRAH